MGQIQWSFGDFSSHSFLTKATCPILPMSSHWNLLKTCKVCNFQYLLLVVTSCNLRGDPGELCAKMGGKVHRIPPIFRGGSLLKWVPSPWSTIFDVFCEVRFGKIR